MKIIKNLLFAALAALAVTLPAWAADEPNHEVWLIDQSNTYDSDGNGLLDSGGILYIYKGSELAENAASNASPQKIDLGGAIAEQVKLTTGTVPVRPHGVAFNRSQTHAIVSFVASGHVLIFNAATRKLVFAVDVGAQAHASVPSPDETYILVANQNGKLLQRINTDYLRNVFALDTNATLNLATGTTPSGALKQDDALTQVNVRPDNAPILARPDSTSTLAFVTLRGGGMFVVNTRVSPMAIVGEYTKATIQPAGLLAIQKADTLYFNSGGGGGATLGFQSLLYRLPVSAFSTTPNVTPDSPAPVVVFDHTARAEKDSHGLMLTKDGRYLWVADRAANDVIVVDTATHSVVNEIKLAGAVSADPAPDLFALSPSGNRVYVSLRGPIPLSGNNTNVNNAKGSTPGLGVIAVEAAGMSGLLQAHVAISNLDGAGVERADAHGVAVRSLANAALSLRPDVVLQHTDGSVAFWTMHGTTISDAIVPTVLPAGWQIVGAGDFNHDGEIDIVLQHTDHSMAFWLMHGATITGSIVPFKLPAGSRVVATGDFNKDGQADLVLRNAFGQLDFWFMDGTSITGTQLSIPLPAGWRIAGTGRFNHTAATDIVLQHTDDSVAFWLMDGTTILNGLVAYKIPLGWQIAATGNYNVDNDTDIVLQHPDGSVAFWLMDGTTIKQGVIPYVIPAAWQTVAPR